MLELLEVYSECTHDAHVGHVTVQRDVGAASLWGEGGSPVTTAHGVGRHTLSLQRHHTCKRHECTHVRHAIVVYRQTDVHTDTLVWKLFHSFLTRTNTAAMATRTQKIISFSITVDSERCSCFSPADLWDNINLVCLVEHNIKRMSDRTYYQTLWEWSDIISNMCVSKT